ncbi:regulatory protein GemA [Labrenzia sp. DG1229]|uniref:regulatory protein GemA n=1 Tax=Labrenzia sp. DG1229 TaxID=681847 RepID=UPI00048FF4DF|nr:regulatory protein GemA [Labrenzia sp. DG1229]
MTAIAKIHVLKNQAKLDDDTYRDILERETGKRSSKGMSHVEQLKVISALKTIAPKQDGQRATGKFARKLQALWIAGYNLGVVSNKSDQAMMAFLKRQTGIEHHRFLQDGNDANKAIDALKLWIRRKTHSEFLFTRKKNRSPIQNDFRFQVCIHIWSQLVALDKAPAGTLTTYLYSIGGQEDLRQFSSNDWIRAMNRLGKLYRSVTK